MDLDYAPSVPADVVADLEQAAGTVGLPLADLELLGQDLLAALGFIAAVNRGPTRSFLEGVDWGRLEAILRTRRTVKRTRVVP